MAFDEPLYNIPMKCIVVGAVNTNTDVIWSCQVKLVWIEIVLEIALEKSTVVVDDSERK